MIRLIQRRGWWYAFSGLLVVGAIVSLSLWGLKWGIDFTGGSLMEVEYTTQRPGSDAIVQSLKDMDLGGLTVQPAGDKGVLLRFRDVTEPVHQQIVEKLKQVGDLTEKSFESIGPIIGSELRGRSLWAVGVSMFFIVSYIAWAFRKVSRPLASWKFGVVAVIALAHDVLTTIGVFSVLGHFAGVEIDSLFVSAVLTVLGFSVHDTIVVFDRTRENLFRGTGGDFESTVNKSVNDTLVRSINTSLTTLLVLVALFLFGGESIRYFVLALIVGITIGTYSSIFVASPLLVDWYRLQIRNLTPKKK